MSSICEARGRLGSRWLGKPSIIGVVVVGETSLLDRRSLGVHQNHLGASVRLTGRPDRNRKNTNSWLSPGGARWPPHARARRRRWRPVDWRVHTGRLFTASAQAWG